MVTSNPGTYRPRKDQDLEMTVKQLMTTVRQGRKVLISILDEEPAIGYLAGWDDENYFILAPKQNDIAKLLVSKFNILFLQMFDERTFREEPLYEEMEKIVRPFRTKLTSEHFQRDE